MATVTTAITGNTFAESKSVEKPNVILILADDLGYRELGCYGQKKIQTPNIDKLAVEGMKFTQAYSGSAVCAPSRCVLMTGKHPGRAYVRDNGKVPIPAGEVTISKMLKKSGYATGCFGKWGLGEYNTTGHPMEQGFDRFFGYISQTHAHSYYPAYLDSDREKVKLNNTPPVPGHAALKPDEDPNDPKSYDRFKGKDYAADRIHNQVMNFIRKNEKKPFFCYYATIIPHISLHVPEEY